jgi:uncharacterized protein YjgD (DUF1641 family)
MVRVTPLATALRISLALQEADCRLASRHPSSHSQGGGSVASVLSAVLSDEALIEQLSRMLITTESLLLAERIPRIMRLLELATRERCLKVAEELLRLVVSLDDKALENLASLLRSLGEVLSKPPKSVGLLGLLSSLRDPEVRAGAAVLISLLRSLAKAQRGG